MLTQGLITSQDQLHYCATMQLNIEKAPSVFQSLSDVTRLRIFRLFLATDEQLCLCDLSVALGEPVYKISRHLKALREAGLLLARRDGKWLFHRLATVSASAPDLFQSIRTLSDPKQQCSRDFARLTKRLAERKVEPCRQTSSRHRGGTV